MDGEQYPQYFSQSQYFLLICLAALAGIFVSASGYHSVMGMGVLLIAAIIILGVFRSRPRFLFAGLVLAAYAAGVCWVLLSDSSHEYQALVARNNRTVIQEEGVVAQEVEILATTQQFVVRLNDASWQGMRILVTAPAHPLVSYGDQILVQGKLQAPVRGENGFDYASYLRKDEIYAILDRATFELRGQNQGNPVIQQLQLLKTVFEANMNRMLGEPHASLVRGILLGENIRDRELRDEFTRTGLIHITALSGSNISLIAIFLSYITTWLVIPRRFAFIINTVLIVLFTVMVGAPASVVRAAIMGILVLFARETGRASTALYAVVIAGLIMVLHNPFLLRFDIGFQLSFLATISLIYLGPIMALFLKPLMGVKSFLKDYLAATLAAQLGTMPLVLYVFGTASFIAPLANIVVLPVIPLIMFFAFLAGLASFAVPLLAQGIALLMTPLLGYVFSVVHLLSRIPFAAVSGGKSSALLLALLSSVLVWIIMVALRKGTLRWYGSLGYLF